MLIANSQLAKKMCKYTSQNTLTKNTFTKIHFGKYTLANFLIELAICWTIFFGHNEHLKVVVAD